MSLAEPQHSVKKAAYMATSSAAKTVVKDDDDDDVAAEDGVGVLAAIRSSASPLAMLIIDDACGCDNRTGNGDDEREAAEMAAADKFWAATAYSPAARFLSATATCIFCLTTSVAASAVATGAVATSAAAAAAPPPPRLAAALALLAAALCNIVCSSLVI